MSWATTKGVEWCIMKLCEANRPVAEIKFNAHTRSHICERVVLGRILACTIQTHVRRATDLTAWL